MAKPDNRQSLIKDYRFKAEVKPAAKSINTYTPPQRTIIGQPVGESSLQGLARTLEKVSPVLEKYFLLRDKNRALDDFASGERSAREAGDINFEEFKKDNPKIYSEDFINGYNKQVAYARTFDYQNEMDAFVASLPESMSPEEKAAKIKEKRQEFIKDVRVNDALSDMTFASHALPHMKKIEETEIANVYNNDLNAKIEAGATQFANTMHLAIANIVPTLKTLNPEEREYAISKAVTPLITDMLKDTSIDGRQSNLTLKILSTSLTQSALAVAETDPEAADIFLDTLERVKLPSGKSLISETGGILGVMKARSQVDAAAYTAMSRQNAMQKIMDENYANSWMDVPQNYAFVKANIANPEVIRDALKAQNLPNAKVDAIMQKINPITQGFRASRSYQISEYNFSKEVAKDNALNVIANKIRKNEEFTAADKLMIANSGVFSTPEACYSFFTDYTKNSKFYSLSANEQNTIMSRIAGMEFKDLMNNKEDLALARSIATEALTKYSTECTDRNIKFTYAGFYDYLSTDEGIKKYYDSFKTQKAKREQDKAELINGASPENADAITKQTLSNVSFIVENSSDMMPDTKQKYIQNPALLNARIAEVATKMSGIIKDTGHNKDDSFGVAKTSKKSATPTAKKEKQKKEDVLKDDR